MTEFTPEQIEQLEAKLDGSKVSTRSQAGRNLSYIEGWWAIHEANRIFGFGGWSHQILEMRPIVEPAPGETNYVSGGDRPRSGYLVAFHCTVRVTVGDQHHDGIGYGSGIDYNDAGSAYESAVKEAETDATKRALRNWGNPFGLALYDKTQAEVDNSGSQVAKAVQNPRRATAPASEYGICPIHNVEWFKRGKMRGPAHPIDGGGWCDKDKVEDGVDTEGSNLAAMRRRAEQVVARLIGGEADRGKDRAEYIVTVIGRQVNHPNELSYDDWQKIMDMAAGDLEARQTPVDDNYYPDDPQEELFS